MKIYKINTSFVNPEGPGYIVCNEMLYMIFKYGRETVLILQILSGFKATLENCKGKNSNHTYNNKT